MLTFDRINRRTHLYLGLFLLPWVLMGARYEPESLPDLAAVGLAWVVQMALAILVVRAGAQTGAMDQA